MDIKKKTYFVNGRFFDRFSEKGGRKESQMGFTIEVPKDLALKILASPVPFIWVRNDFLIFDF